MLATLTQDRFSDPDWIFERKLDGVRCLARRTASGQVHLASRNDQDLTSTFPEIAQALAANCDSEIVVDGEVVALQGRRTSFERLQGRLGITDPDVARRVGIPVFYYLFDVLHLDGADTRHGPLVDRKKLLRGAVRFQDPLRYTVHRIGAGEQMYRAACARGDEGVVAKRAAAAYTGGRSKDWLKFKYVRDQELVIGGWTEPKGNRTGLGALLVGYYENGTLVYAGKVGTGFGTQTLQRLSGQLAPLAQDHTPFDRGRIRETGVHWVRPELVAQIGFAEWTQDGLLRQPRFQGLRTDKVAEDVVRETR
jgi:DNA ligase D-like protein (predicted ligase)